MATWIQNENGDVLLNTDHVLTLKLRPAMGADLNEDDFRILASGPDWDAEMITNLTFAQAERVMQHLRIWLPAQTSRTLHMAELGMSVRAEKKGDRP